MNAIVAVDANWAIGLDGGMLFHLPGDLKYFRQKTAGGTLIMGRRTLESFPDCKPLPRRRNIVISRRPDYAPEGVEVVKSPEEALALCAGTDPDSVWCIGGGSVYRAMLHRCRRVYVTKLEIGGVHADTFFPDLDQLPDWTLESQSERIEDNGIFYRFQVYVNRDPK